MSFNNAPGTVAVDMETEHGKLLLHVFYRSTSLPIFQNDVISNCIKSICKESNEY